MSDDKKRRSEADARKVDEKLDEALEETFPASDPPSMTAPARAGPVKDRPERKEKTRRSAR